MNWWKNRSSETKLFIGIVVFMTLVLLFNVARADPSSVPAVAAQYERPLTNVTQSVYGLDAPVARMAALIHVESAWNPEAESPFAQGLAQFTPMTATWIAEIRPELGPADPWDPKWSMWAAAEYTKLLYNQVKPMAQEELAECEHWAMDLSAYNGGATWVKRDRILAQTQGADPDRWFGHTERFSRRAQWAFEENRHYPRKILLNWEHRYLEAGWPGSPACLPA